MWFCVDYKMLMILCVDYKMLMCLCVLMFVVFAGRTKWAAATCTRAPFAAPMGPRGGRCRCPTGTASWRGCCRASSSARGWPPWSSTSRPLRPSLTRRCRCSSSLRWPKRWLSGALPLMHGKEINDYQTPCCCCMERRLMIIRRPAVAWEGD